MHTVSLINSADFLNKSYSSGFKVLCAKPLRVYHSGHFKHKANLFIGSGHHNQQQLPINQSDQLMYIYSVSQSKWLAHSPLGNLIKSHSIVSPSLCRIHVCCTFIIRLCNARTYSILVLKLKNDAVVQHRQTRSSSATDGLHNTLCLSKILSDAKQL